MSNNKSINKSRAFKTQTQDNYDTTSSILSDYDELDGAYDMINDGDDQSSYVLFNPVKKPSGRNESDILSSTNTALTTGEQTDEEEDEEQEEDLEDEDEVDSQYELFQPDPQNRKQRLSFKIDSWYDSNMTNSDMIEDDNIASWNLDENLISGEENELGTSHDASIDDSGTERFTSPFYGDDLLAHLNKEELAKFKRFHHMYDLKSYLLSRGTSSPTSQSRRNRLMKLLLDNQTLLEEAGTTLVGSGHNALHTTSSLKRGAYISQLKRAASSATLARQRHLYTLTSHSETSIAHSAFSDGGSSSLVMCGGSSWNDI